MVKCLENVSFVTNGIHLQFKRRIICKSCTKYFTYKLSNCLVTSPLITIVELIPSITSRPSMNYPIERFIAQSQSDLCLCLFIVTVPILSFLYMCNVLLHMYCLLALSSVPVTIIGSEHCSFPSAILSNPWMLRTVWIWYFHVWKIFFKYRDVIKTATQFVVMMTIIRVALTFVESVDKMEFLLNFSEQWTFS